MEDLNYYEMFMHRVSNNPKDPFYELFETEVLMIHPETLPVHRQIKLKRCYDDLTQSDLCTLLGLPSVAVLSEIETGKRKIPKKHLDTFFRYLYQTWMEEGELIAIIDEDF